MSTDKSAEIINAYRRLHRRCRTCSHASNGSSSWFCAAKMKRHPFGDVFTTTVAGCFCRMYKPKEY